ncbi:dTDP-4-amino-4,6-dideoxygalactose transaminase [compost metagenome]
MYGQLERCEYINSARLALWEKYHQHFKSYEKKGVVDLPVIPDGCVANAHMYYMKVKDINVRTAVLSKLKEAGVGAVFHYIPLHSAPAGKKLGVFSGDDKFTTRESERLIRLPLWLGMNADEENEVKSQVTAAIMSCGA